MTKHQRFRVTFCVYATGVLLLCPVLGCLSVSCTGDTPVPPAPDKTVGVLRLSVKDATTKERLPALVNFHTATGEPVTFGNFADLPGWSQGGSAIELGKVGEAMFAFRHGLALWKGEGTLR